VRRVVVGAVALALILAGLACNRGAAEESLQEAEGAIEDARDHLERYAPEELAALNATLEDARADVDAGHYTRALRAAQELPARIRSARATGDRRKAELAAQWGELSPRVETLVGGLRARVGRLATAEAGPTTTPRETQLRAARTELVALAGAWQGARAAHEKGDLSRAVRMAQDVHLRARALAETLGSVTTPRPPAAE
jgi:hypothetical protein